MSLAAGVRLGPYEITGWIAAGGMGDVYRARDTRLGRSVAVKVLPDHALNTPARRARFEREARAISHLTHPSICTLYDVGEHDGVPFVVMEYVEGETLAERLLRGPLPLAEIARAGADLANALDHAHRHGIVHRDLKPANIMMTADGVRLLDFGVANFASDLQAADTVPGHASAATESLTNPGQILGTIKYMAPEQLEGRRVDLRTDIFALGLVLYEMATNCAPFESDSQAGTIAAILSTDAIAVSVARKQAGADQPAAGLFDEVVARCLAKDPEKRWQSARDLGQALQWVEANARRSEPLNHLNLRQRVDRPAGPLVLGLGLLAALLVVLAIANRERATATRPSRWVVTPPEGSTFDPSGYSMALSPDGSQLAFIASSASGDNALWVRPLDAVAPRKLAEGAAQPFWSADSRALAFDGGGQFKKVDLATGLVVPLGEAFVQSGSWNRADTLLLAMPLAERRYNPHGLHTVSASGGRLTPATMLDSGRAEFNHIFPQFLPDGRRFLFMARSKDPEHDGMLQVGSLDSSERVTLFQSPSRAVYASGYLIFARDGALLAQKFDPNGLRLLGSPVLVADHVEQTMRFMGAAFSVSDTGVLAYRPDRQTALVWFDRSGRSLGAIGQPGHYSNPDLSRDERRVAVSRRDPLTGQADVWVIDVNRGLQSKLTFGEAVQGMPLWSPDGRRVVYRAGASLVMKESSGAGRDTVLADHLTNFDNPLDWSADGEQVLLSSFDSSNETDLWLLSAGDDRQRTAVPDSGSRWGVQARISPDGRWLAYASNESGRYEVYVRPFQSGNGRWLITSGGGSEPSWRRDGKELYYIAPDGTLTAVQVSIAPTFEAGTHTRLFKTDMSTLVNTSFTRNQYVASADGRRFLVNQPTGGPAAIVVVVDWVAGLKRRE